MTHTDSGEFQSLLTRPLQVGPMQLKSRIVHPPHSMAIGRLLGSDRQAEINRDYWRLKAGQGPGWVVAVSGVVDVPLIPGFEPIGIGAVSKGLFGHPRFHDRASALVQTIHEQGTYALCQLIMNGGQPHGAGAFDLSGMMSTQPHPMTLADIEAAEDEFVRAARAARRAGFDGVELHACHDDVLEWFLSPLSNDREDGYGGNTGARSRMLREIVVRVRAECGPSFAIGVRLQVEQGVPGGYDVEEAIRIARLLHAEGATDYLSWVYGANWGEHTYMPSSELRPAPWAHLVARVRAQVPMPMVYTGRVKDADAVARVLRDGQADLVGVVRATIADPEFVRKLTTGHAAEVRPCIGCNECLHRPLLDGLPTACAVNPYLLGRRARTPRTRRRVLVVGGGPAGMEAACLLAEDGNEVTLAEAQPVLGGQLTLAARTLEHRDLNGYLGFQRARLSKAGVDVQLGRLMSAQDVAGTGADVVIVAAGSRPRRRPLKGSDAPCVVDSRDALLEQAKIGAHVAVIAEDDTMQPLTVAAHLARGGRRVDLIYRAREVAATIGRYAVGAPLAAVLRAGGECHVLQRVDEITDGGVRVQSVFGGGHRTIGGIDTVVLACGSTPNSELAASLSQADIAAHVIGDAYAPRGIGAATHQAAALADSLAAR